jgi:hypothetical protein
MDELNRLVRTLTPEDRQVIAFLDLQRLQVENTGLSVQATEPTYGVLNCLRFWEILIRRMEDEWRRQDYYLVEEYLNVLTGRDGLEDFIEAMPPASGVKVRSSLDRLDHRYLAVTQEDGGAELAQYWRPLAEGRETRWWWTRRPEVLPPGW